LLLLRARKFYTWILCWAAPALYYGYVGFSGTTEVPHQILRAFCSLSLGVMAYMLSRYVGKMQLGKKARVALTAAELLCFAGVLAITYMINGGEYSLEVMALMMVGCVLCFPDKATPCAYRAGSCAGWAR